MSAEILHSGSWEDVSIRQGSTTRGYEIKDSKNNSGALIIVSEEPGSKKVNRQLHTASIEITEEPLLLNLPQKVINIFRRDDHKIRPFAQVVNLTITDDYVRSDAKLQEVLKERGLPAFGGVKQKAPLP